MVIKLNDTTLWSRLGAHSRAPRYAYAITFISNLSIATISDIRIQVGKFGNLTPVADLVPTCMPVGVAVVVAAVLWQWRW